jgi:hypothetical protein
MLQTRVEASVRTVKKPTYCSYPERRESMCGIYISSINQNNRRPSHSRKTNQNYAGSISNVDRVLPSATRTSSLGSRWLLVARPVLHSTEADDLTRIAILGLRIDRLGVSFEVSEGNNDNNNANDATGSTTMTHPTWNTLEHSPLF